MSDTQCPAGQSCERTDRANVGTCTFLCKTDADCPAQSMCQTQTGHCICGGPPGGDDGCDAAATDAGP
ncbi:MAG: hypothetical protein ACHQ53_05430 [Polyangiales bacterium]